jgi:hypothetical protein
MMAAERNGIMMLAQIAVKQAIHQDIEPERPPAEAYQEHRIIG